MTHARAPSTNLPPVSPIAHSSVQVFSYIDVRMREYNVTLNFDGDDDDYELVPSQTLKEDDL